MKKRKPKPVPSTACVRVAPIDTLKEKIYPLKNKSAINTSIHPETLKRWCTHGHRSPVNGLIVILPSLFEGRTRCTSKEAYARFLIAVNMPLNGRGNRR